VMVVVAKLLDRVLNDLSPGTSQFKVLIYLAFKGPSSPSQVSEDTGISPGTVRPALRALLSKRFVIQLRDGSYQSKIAFTDVISDIYSNYIRKQ
jgi:DNA-binding MarR family transcriptional regulator